ncbi:hypothetical protein INH39_16355 [Massilia violaceinigra]|uniref:Uncharacterized protein n=1 Tax=Massilia violaceinigra TaxID=2045208 RepID=A0ABY4AE42_9BURK|nr:hypothetical protein [Massilia violaceinigra]UOD33066.1 hypothetical protein INH39_16355 [Massilia violaceinigra]
MSLDLLIFEPVSEEERKVFYPICSEGAFRNFIKPISFKHDLHMIAGWHPFVHVDKTNIDEFLRQMEILMQLIEDAGEYGDITIDTRIYFDMRLYGMVDLIKQLLQSRPDLIVSIG